MNDHNGLKVVFSNPDFAVVEKPAGLSVHNESDSVISRLGPEFHLVHRLDKETSGLLVVTKKPALQEELQKAMHLGAKEYVCVLRGVIEPQAEWQTWNFAVSDTAEGRDNPAGPKDRQVAAETLYRAETNNPYFSLVRCRLRSGRQHQIRKHAALAGRPVVGDSRYGQPKDNSRIQTRYGFSRLALHAERLEFEWQGEKIAVQAPRPEEFNLLFKV